MGKVCKECGADNKADALFCLACGKAFDRFCTKCGTKTSNPKALYCLECGSPFIVSESGKKNNEKELIARGLGIVFIGLIVIASFLPFFDISVLGVKQTVSLWDEKFVLLSLIGSVLLFADLIIILANTRKMPSDTIVLGVIILIDIIIQYTYNRNRLQSISIAGSSYDLSGALTPGSGFYLIIAGCIGLIISGVLMGIYRSSSVRK